MSQSLDWNDVRFFLAVARERTLARAAASLGVDQTTVGRRIASLEGRLRVALFMRTADGLRPSTAGAEVLDAAERMEEAALELRSLAAGEEASTAGTVRIATTDSLAEAFVVPAIARVRTKHPRVHFVVSTGWTRVDLRKGEADLAVRIVRPTDPRLACRKLADFHLRLYASRDWIAEHGAPRSLAGQPLLAYEDAVRTGARHPFGGLSMDGSALVLLANSHGTLLRGARGGLGIVQLPSYVGDANPDLVQVLPEADEAYGVWLVVPLANRRIPAIRAATEAIAEVFSERPRSARIEEAPGSTRSRGAGAVRPPRAPSKNDPGARARRK